MRKDKFIFALFIVFFLSGCKGYYLAGPFEDKIYKGSMCKRERPMRIEYAPQEYMEVPTCQMSDLETAKFEGLYEPYGDVDEEEFHEAEPIKPIKLEPKPDEWDVDPNDIEGDFPLVYDNKHDSNQVIMQNLESRVLAFCRGSQIAIDVCVERLSCAGFERITNVPRVTAKYDLAPTKGYPARRWREGESVPRW